MANRIGTAPAQTHPRNVETRLGREAPERQQAGENRDGTRHEDHKRADRTAEDQHLGTQQFVAVDEKPQREEHHDLHEPRETVEEDRQRAFLRQLMVAHDQTREVNRQVAVALERGP